MKHATSVLVVLVMGMISFSTLPCMAAQSSPMAEKKEVQEKQNGSELKVTFVELGSTRCIPCRMMQPVMAEIEKQYKDQVKVVFYDVWTAAGKSYGEKYRVRAIPTQVFLDSSGKEYYRHEGFFPKEEIDKVLQKQGVR